MAERAILVRDWRQMKTVLSTARAAGSAPTLVTPENAASTYGAGYLAALQDRARQEFPDVAFTLIVDCGDAPGHALACLRAGVKRVTASRSEADKMAGSFAVEVLGKRLLSCPSTFQPRMNRRM